MTVIDKPWGKEYILDSYEDLNADNNYCIKKIVAESNLSLQVHYDKTETFVAIKDSIIFIMMPDTLSQILHNITYNTFKNICDNEEILNNLLEVKLPKGSAFKLIPGTLHYIKGGSEILEYSNGPGAALSSDSTLRLFDWYEPKRDLHTFEVYRIAKGLK